MSDKELKQNFPICWSIINREGRYLLYHAFKAREDRDTLLRYIKQKRYDLLDYMEQFYAHMRETDRICERDIMSRTYTQSLDQEKFKKGYRARGDRQLIVNFSKRKDEDF